MTDGPGLSDGRSGGRVRAVVFRGLVALATLATLRSLAALLGLAHAGWIAAAAGVPLAALAAWRVGEPAEFLPPAATLPVWRAPQPMAPVRGVLAVGAAATALTLLPLLIHPLPPFDDYLNHLARIFIIAAHGRDPLLARFYTIEWRLIPNLAMDLLVPPLVPLLGIFVAGKLFLVITTLLLLGGPLAIHWALYRRLSAGPLAAALFLHTYVEKMGVLNYQFSVGLALLMVAAWIGLERRGALLRGVVSGGFVVVLFFGHLVALGIYGIGITAVAAAGGRRRPADAAALLLPFGLVWPLLLLGPGDSPPLLPDAWGGVGARLNALRLLFAGYDPVLDALLLLGLAAGLLLAVRAGGLRLHPAGWMTLLLGGAVFLVMPNRVMGSWGGAAWLAFGLVMLLSGMLWWRWPGRRAMVAFVALLLLRVAATEEGFIRYDRVQREVVASLAQLAPGSRILIAADYDHADDALRAIWDLPCLAVMTRSSLVSLVYTDPRQQVLTLRPAWRGMAGGYNDDPVALPDLLYPPAQDAAPDTLPYDPSGRIYWRDWPHDYDNIYVMDRLGAGSPDPARLVALFAAGRVQLFQVRP